MQEFLSTINPYLRICRRKYLLIIGLTTLTTSAALLFSLKDPNTYVTSFRLLLEPSDSTGKLSQASTLTRTEGLPDQDAMSLDYPTQLEILKSSGMLSKISDRVSQKLSQPRFTEPQPSAVNSQREINQEETTDKCGYLSRFCALNVNMKQSQSEINVASINQDLHKNLSVERITIGPSRYDWTKIVEVTYKAQSPHLVKAVAEATAEEYLQYSLEERQNSIDAGVDFIDEQLPELKERLSALQSRQQDLQQKNHLIDPNYKGQELFTQVDELKNKKIANERELLELQTLARTLEQQLNLTPEQGIIALTLNQNPNNRELLRQIQKIEGDIAAESARFTPNSPQVLALKEDKKNLLVLLEQKTKPILKQHSIALGDDGFALNYQNESFLKLTQQLVDTQNQIKVLQVRNRSLTTNQKNLLIPARKLPQIAREYNELEQELALTTQILDRLLTQRETLRVEAAQKDIPWKLLGKADVARDAYGKPDSFAPNRTRKIMAGMAGGMFFAIAISILWEKRRNIFYTAEDIQDLFLLPLLGKIPPSDRFRLFPNFSFNSSALAVVETHGASKKSLFSKSFESLYAELTFLYADNPINSLVISSVESKDGQSTVAIELAKTAAKEGKRVLLVDANLARPQLYTQLNLPRRRLNSSKVHGDRSVAERVIYKVPEVNNLYVLTADILKTECASKLWSTKMQNLMEHLSSKYDLVIYDAPHFLDTPDVSFLAAQTDGIVMVVGVKKTRQSLVRDAMEQINAFRLTNLGIVANHFGS